MYCANLWKSHFWAPSQGSIAYLRIPERLLVCQVQDVREKLYLFLDEVQNVPGWERWVRRIQDTEDASIFVTGSSSRLLTRDLSTALRGRSITMEVFPPERDMGHKLETAVFLEMRRRRKNLHYYINAHAIDLCDSEGTLFINVCYNLAEGPTARRESAAMAYGHSRWPGAHGSLIYHDYSPGVLNEIEETQPACIFLQMLQRLF
ncbi:MAG: hypothetical protein EOM20_10405 [Spartobacteria bacterium]|nr:hypothetical protein [Spartobacteria bacterium]